MKDEEENNKDEKRQDENEKRSPAKHSLTYRCQRIAEATAQETPLTDTIVDHGHVPQQETNPQPGEDAEYGK